MGVDENVHNEVAKPKAQPSTASFKMRPSLGESFKGNRIKSIIKEVLMEKLQGKAYNSDEVGNWTRDIADGVNMLVKERVHMPRYKYVVQVMLGQQIGAGCHYFAKCYWDVEADSYTSHVFNNATLFCVCTVFGIYLY